MRRIVKEKRRHSVATLGKAQAPMAFDVSAGRWS